MNERNQSIAFQMIFKISIKKNEKKKKIDKFDLNYQS